VILPSTRSMNTGTFQILQTARALPTRPPTRAISMTTSCHGTQDVRPMLVSMRHLIHRLMSINSACPRFNYELGQIEMG